MLRGMHPARRRLLRGAFALPLVALLWASPRPLRAQEAPETLDRARMKQLTALCERFAKAAESPFPDGAMMLVENDAAAEPPIPASAVAPLVEALVELRMKHGPTLKKKGSDYFYDEESKRGFYMVSRGKKGGGLLLSLHGGGEGQGDAGSAHGIWGSASSKGFTVISPEVMEKVSSAWNMEPEEQMVLALIDAAKRTFEVDPRRICIAGHSMGGDGTWMIGGRNADVFAAAAPLAGSVMPYMRPGTLNRIDTPLSDYQGLMEGVVANLMHVPYHIHHSDDDRNEAIHPDDIATGYLKRLQQLFPGKYVFTYDRVSGNGHALPATGVKPIIEWLSEQERVTYPDEVVWETWWPWKRRMYWLYHPEPKSAWRFHGKVLGDNHIDLVATSKPAAGRTEPDAFTVRVLLSSRMVDLSRPVRITSGDKVLFEGVVPRSVWALLVTAGRSMDPTDTYEAFVDVEVPRVLWFDLWDGLR